VHIAGDVYVFGVSFDMNHRQKAIQLVRDFGELTPAELRRAWRARFGADPGFVRFHREGEAPAVKRADYYTRCAITGERVRPWVPLKRSD
jgi:hypothetical protein